MFEKPFLGKNNRNEKKTTLSRRGFLKGALATSALSIIGGGGVAEAVLREKDISLWLKERTNRMRFEDWSSLSREEREEKIDTEVDAYRAFLRSPGGERILEEGTDDEIFILLHAMPAFLRAHIEGTKHDVRQDEWPSLAVSFLTDEGNPEVLEVAEGSDALKDLYCGNGFAIAENVYLTNVHILEYATEDFAKEYGLEDALSPQIRQGYTDNGLDVVAIFMPSAKHTTIRYPTGEPPCAVMDDDDVHGNLIRVAGFDPDETAGPDGTKVYPSVAIKITPRICEFLNIDESARENLFGSFLYLLPPGESYGRPYPSRTGSRLLDRIEGKEIDESRLRAQGTSGSPVLLDDSIIGINHSCYTFEYGGISFDVGFFHGPNAIQKAMTLDMVHRPSKLKSGSLGKTDFGG